MSVLEGRGTVGSCPSVFDSAVAWLPTRSQTTDSELMPETLPDADRVARLLAKGPRELPRPDATAADQSVTLRSRLIHAGFGVWFLIFTVLNTMIATLVLSASLSWPVVDALYYVVTALTTVGFGDLNVSDASAGLKVYVIYLMLCGAGSYSALLAILVDRVVQLNLHEYFEGRRRKSMGDHVVLCGLGNLGSRILEELEEQGEEVVVIECVENRFVRRCRTRGVRVFVDDIKEPDVLREAGVGDAKCIILATDHDLDNLEAALAARDINPHIRVVMRMYDRSLARRLDQAFNFGRTFSASEIAAPQFANAVNISGVSATVEVQDVDYLLYELEVASETRLDGMTCGEVRDETGAAVMAITRRGESYEPQTSARLEAGDELVFAIRRDALDQLLRLNVV